MKKVFALLCALLMIMSVTFSVSAAPAADAKGVFISYNADQSTEEYAIYELYIKGFGTAIKKINISQYVDTTVFECPASGTTSILETSYVSEGTGNMGTLSYKGKVTFSWNNGSGTFAIREDGLIATLKFPIKNATASEWIPTGTGAFQKVTDANGTELNFANGTNVTGDYAGYVFVADKYVPVSAGGEVAAEPAGTFTDAANAKAVAYYAELDETASGKTAYWTATIGTDAMKTESTFALPNISAGTTAKLGLIYKGTEAVSAVKLVWE